MRWLKALKYSSRSPEIWRCLRRCRNPRSVIRRYLSGGETEYPFELELTGGGRVDLRNYHDLVTAWVVFLRDEYKVPTDATTVLDVGANIGCFSLRCALGRPDTRIVAAEPFPDTYARLRGTVTGNGLEARVACWPLGIAAESGTRAMPVDDGPSQSRGILPPGAESTTQLEVTVLSFDDLLRKACAELRTEVIDFVKVDVEGGEHESILASPPDSFRRFRRLGMEYHPNRPKGPLFSYLRAAGFRLEHDRVFGPDVGVSHFSRAT